MWEHLFIRPAVLALRFSNCFGFFDTCPPCTLFLPHSPFFPCFNRLSGSWFPSQIPSSDHLQIFLHPFKTSFGLLPVLWTNYNPSMRLPPGQVLLLIFPFGSCFALPMEVASIFGAFEVTSVQVVSWEDTQYCVHFLFILKLYLLFIHEPPYLLFGLTWFWDSALSIH